MTRHHVCLFSRAPVMNRFADGRVRSFIRPIGFAGYVRISPSSASHVYPMLVMYSVYTPVPIL